VKVWYDDEGRICTSEMTRRECEVAAAREREMVAQAERHASLPLYRSICNESPARVPEAITTPKGSSKTE
jgi:hypothetical protein